RDPQTGPAPPAMGFDGQSPSTPDARGARTVGRAIMHGSMKAVLLAATLLLACNRPTGHRTAVGPEIVEAAAGAVPELVRAARAAADRDGRQLLIYVSATWCEPCERFQRALRAGQLNASFPRLTLLKFDSD